MTYLSDDDIYLAMFLNLRGIMIIYLAIWSS